MNPLHRMSRISEKGAPSLLDLQFQCKPTLKPGLMAVALSSRKRAAWKTFLTAKPTFRSQMFHS